jgi:hypothetical protein
MFNNQIDETIARIFTREIFSLQFPLPSTSSTKMVEVNGIEPMTS